jgi:hypothetical protein
VFFYPLMARRSIFVRVFTTDQQALQTTTGRVRIDPQITIFCFKDPKSFPHSITQPNHLHEALGTLTTTAHALKNQPKLFNSTLHLPQTNFFACCQVGALRGDTEVVRAALRHTDMALKYARRALRNDPALCCAAVAQDWRALQWCSDAR